MSLVAPFYVDTVYIAIMLCYATIIIIIIIIIIIGGLWFH